MSNADTGPQDDRTGVVEGDGATKPTLRQVAEAINKARYVPDGLPYRTLDECPSDISYCERLARGVVALYATPTAVHQHGRREGLMRAADVPQEEVEAYLIELYGTGFYNQTDQVQTSSRRTVVRCLKAVAAIRAEAQALLMSAAEDGWQPIKTAPRDNTPILL